MHDEAWDKLTQMNNRLLLLLGYTASLLMELAHKLPEDDKHTLTKVIEAIDNVVYLDKPFPITWKTKDE